MKTFLLGLLAATSLGVGLAQAQDQCRSAVFDNVEQGCDLGGKVSCMVEFGLFRDSLDDREAGCDPPALLQARMAALRQKLGDDVSRIARSDFYQSLRLILQNAGDETTSFWVILINRSDQPVEVTLYALVASEADPELRSIPNDGDWEDQNGFLFAALARENDSGAQVTSRLRPFHVTLGPHDVRTMGVHLGAHQAGKSPGYYPIGLFREAAINRYGVSHDDLLGLGVLRLR
ncbi:MAG: hypothetical protein QM608_21815 [Caulobacter sp.]